MRKFVAPSRYEGRVDFDVAAATWDDEPRRVELARAVSDALARTVPLTGEMDALDYGCGTGLVTLALAPRLGSVTAVDSSPGMIAVLERKIEERGIRNVKALLLDLGLQAQPQARYDLIFSSMTLHHVRDVNSLLARFSGLLRPAGYLAVADLDREDGSFHRGREVAHRGFARGAFASMLARAGFEGVVTDTAHVIRREAPRGGWRDYSVFIAAGRRRDDGPLG